MYFLHGAAKKIYKKYDVARISCRQPVVHTVIIGSGCAGLTAATYARRLGLEVLVITGDMPGGLITETGMVENWPGSTQILGSEIADNLKKQAEMQGAYFLEDTVTRVDFSCWPFKLYTENDRCIQALSVIIATGSSPKKLGIPGEKEYWGAGVSACAVCDAPLYKGKEVFVIGGGDSAIEEAILLSQYAKRVTILVRRDSMRASQHMQDRLREYPTISVVYNIQPQEIIGNRGRVSGLKVLNTESGEQRDMSTEGIFLAIGHEPNTKIFKDYIELDDMSGTIKLIKGTKETSVEGIFAAGDVAGRRRQACVAAGSGAEAALDAKEWLDGIGFTKQVATKLCLFKPDMVEEQSSTVPVVGDGSVKELFSLADFTREIEEKKGLVCMNIVDAHDDADTGKESQEIVQEIAQELAGTMAFVTIDKTKAADIAQRFFVERTPCRLVFNNGSLVARNQKKMEASELRDFVLQVAHEAVAASHQVNTSAA
jgi:thioredoxin reductase (NADPH)